MSDWDAGPSLTQNYSAFVSSIDARLDDAAVMFDGTGTNLPDDAIKWDTGASQFQQYSSASSEWNPLATVFEMTVSAAGLVGGAGRDQYVSTTSGNPTMSDIAFDIDDLTYNTLETVGKTGSGATHIWTALDSIPSDVSWIDIKVEATISRATATSVYIKLYAMSGDVSPALSAANRIMYLYINDANAATTKTISGINTAKIPLNSSIVFKLQYLTTTSGNLFAGSNMYITGYGWS